MTTRADIIDGKDAQLPDGSIRKYGLIYTQKCGWVDLGHANPEGRGFSGASSSRPKSSAACETSRRCA